MQLNPIEAHKVLLLGGNSSPSHFLSASLIISMLLQSLSRDKPLELSSSKESHDLRRFHKLGQAPARQMLKLD